MKPVVGASALIDLELTWTFKDCLVADCFPTDGVIPLLLLLALQLLVEQGLLPTCEL